MDLQLKTKSWKLCEVDGQKTIGGIYEVKCSGQVVAEKEFNGGYGCIKINIPAELLVEIEALDKRVRQAIVENFIGDSNE